MKLKIHIIIYYNEKVFVDTDGYSPNNHLHKCIKCGGEGYDRFRVDYQVKQNLSSATLYFFLCRNHRSEGITNEFANSFIGTRVLVGVTNDGENSGIQWIQRGGM